MLKTTINTTYFSEIRQKAGISLEKLSDISGYSLRTLYRWETGEQEPRKAVLKMIEDLIANSIENSNKNSDFTFIDLFAGIGGIRKPFSELGGKCVFTSEWDKYSQMTYKANFPNDNHEISGDITQIDEKEIPKHDLLLAGFPCQPFSIAGVSKKNSMGIVHGFKDKTQGTLFFDVARIIAHHKPKAFLLENVKNLISHDKGKTFQTIKTTLEDELGYTIRWQIINSKSFVPQKRQRIFIVGFKKENEFSFSNVNIPNPEEGPRIKSILHKASEEADGTFLTKKGTVNEKYTLTPKLWEYLQNYAKKHKEKGNGFGFGLCDEDSVARTLSARYYKDGSEILIQQENKRPRRLTPRECARLMGFDTEYFQMKIPVSDTQAYKQFGNAVVVPVVKVIAKEMIKYL
jgi:DNA (cytosine-5)-methyltransferase 1